MLFYHDSSLFQSPIGAGDVALDKGQDVGDNLIGNSHGKLANTGGAWRGEGEGRGKRVG